MFNHQFIECSKGDTISQIKFPTIMFERIVGLLQQYNFHLKFDSPTMRDLKRSKNFLRRVVPFMMTAFIQYLRSKESDAEILESLLEMKKNKESKQHKYELSDLRSLVEQDQRKRGLFLQAFEEFFKSSFLVEYIKDNQKVQSNFNRQLYLKTRNLFIEEIHKRGKIFIKFISDINAAKISKYWRELEEELGEQNSQSPQFTSEEQSVEVKPTQESSNINDTEDYDRGQYYQFESQVQIPQQQYFYEEMDD